MTLNERLREAFDKRVCGTAMLPASDLLSAMTAIEQAEAENAALKEQVAQLESLVSRYSKGMRENLAEALKGQETISQQAEAIEKLRDHIELSLEFCDEEGFCVRDNLENALAIQPSPDILQARDERVAKAIAKYLRAVGVLSYEGTALQGIISGEWRKYL